MARMPLVSDAELDGARATLDKLKSLGKASWAVRFRNSMRAFLEYWDPYASSREIVRVLCADTTEVVALYHYNYAAFHSFSFGQLLVDPHLQSQPGANINKGRIAESLEELNTLDNILCHYFIERRKERYVMLDPFLEEIIGLEEASEKRLTRLFEAPDRSGPLINATQLARIRDWVLGQPTDGQVSAEWQNFCRDFLPKWRRDLADVLLETSDFYGDMQRFRRDRKFYRIGGSDLGEQSIVGWLNNRRVKFDWADYERFIRNGDVLDEYDDVVDVVSTLIAHGPGSERRQGITDLSTQRDARAFATMHIMNEYMRKSSHPCRLELVTRSPILHNIIASLPENRLRVWIRHPLLTPDMYSFSAEALAAIREIVFKVDTLMGPAFEALDGGGLPAAQSDTNGLNDLHGSVAKVASGLVGYLRDGLTVQQSVEVDEPIFSRTVSQTYRHVMSPDSGGGSNIQLTTLKDRVSDVFAALSKSLSRRSDPFSRAALAQIAERNGMLLDLEFRRLKLATRVLPVRYSRIGGGQTIAPCDFWFIRPLGAGFSRLFHFYSRSLSDFFQKSIRALRGSVSDDLAQFEAPHIGEIDVAELLSRATLAYEKIKPSHDEDTSLLGMDGPWVEYVEFLLLACVTLVSFHRLETAIVVSSSVLSRVTHSIRTSSFDASPIPDGTDMRLPLALREMFIFRQYCERAIAVRDYFTESASLSKAKAMVARNFGRAQRDLDYATLMSEEAERRYANSLQPGTESIVDLRIRPAGLHAIRDLRLSLISASSWADQFLVGSYQNTEAGVDPFHREDDDGARELRRRLDIWTAIDVVKDLDGVAYAARTRSAASAAAGLGGEGRYLAHVESRAIQTILMVFLIFLTHDVSQEMRDLWYPRRTAGSDKLLVFRRWKQWWIRYRELKDQFEFQLSLFPVIDAACDTLNKIDELRRVIPAGTADWLSESAKEADAAYTRILDAFRVEIMRLSSIRNAATKSRSAVRLIRTTEGHLLNRLTKIIEQL